MSKYDNVCIMADFNFSPICWDGAWTYERDNDLKECLGDAYLTQRSTEKPNKAQSKSNVKHTRFDSGL